MQGVEQANAFVQKFNEVILFPTIGLLSAVALLVFIYGCFLYIVRSADPSARAEGVRHITWGIVGLVVMLSAYTILSIFAGTFGLQEKLDCAKDPSQSGCGQYFLLPDNDRGGLNGQPTDNDRGSVGGDWQDNNY